MYKYLEYKDKILIYRSLHSVRCLAAFMNFAFGIITCGRIKPEGAAPYVKTRKVPSLPHKLNAPNCHMTKTLRSFFVSSLLPVEEGSMCSKFN